MVLFPEDDGDTLDDRSQIIPTGTRRERLGATTEPPVTR